MLEFPAASQATARTMPSLGAFGTRASPAASASCTRLRVPKRSGQAGRLAHPDPSGKRCTILTFGCRVSAMNGTATVEVANASVASTTAS